MATATIVFGLCGSGKTWLAKQISASTGAQRFDGPYGNNLWPAITCGSPKSRSRKNH
jgi:adenylate kinase family enzyme